MDMEPVADEFSHYVLPFGGGADHAGLAVMDGGHGVEKMGQMPGAGRKASRAAS